jgi:hypothetical protein
MPEILLPLTAEWYFICRVEKKKEPRVLMDYFARTKEVRWQTAAEYLEDMDVVASWESLKEAVRIAEKVYLAEPGDYTLVIATNRVELGSCYLEHCLKRRYVKQTTGAVARFDDRFSVGRR